MQIPQAPLFFFFLIYILKNKFENFKCKDNFVIFKEKIVIRWNFDNYFINKAYHCYFLNYWKNSYICHKPKGRLVKFTPNLIFSRNKLNLFFWRTWLLSNSRLRLYRCSSSILNKALGHFDNSSLTYYRLRSKYPYY